MSNSFTAGPGEMDYDRDQLDDGPQPFSEGQCRTDGCENRAESYCQSCLDAHERRMLGPADAFRRQKMRRGAA